MRVMGKCFNLKHAAGVTRYRVSRAHRDTGFYECVAVRGVSGSHHFIGSIQVLSRADVEAALCEERERVAAECAKLRDVFCPRCGGGSNDTRAIECYVCGSLADAGAQDVR